jgi:hypothetical protein
VGPGFIEPSADKRTAAREMHEMFAAYVHAGFSRREAMELTKVMLLNAMQSGAQPNNNTES